MSTLLVLAVMAAESANQGGPAPGCKNGLLGPEAPDLRFVLESYPSAKLDRPLTLPRWTWSISAAGVYSGIYSSLFAIHGGGSVLGLATTPACNVEVSVLAAQQFAPSPHPLSAVALQVVVALTSSVGISATSQIAIQPSGAGLRAAVAYVGAPIRFRLSEGLGLVGLEQLLGAEIYWGPSLPTIVVPTAGLPIGLLLQPTHFISVEARVRPRVGLNPLVFWRVDFEAEFLISPRNWIDLFLTGQFSTGSAISQLVVSQGIRLRL